VVGETDPDESRAYQSQEHSQCHDCGGFPMGAVRHLVADLLLTCEQVTLPADLPPRTAVAQTGC
jgi:hypothetical protein